MLSSFSKWLVTSVTLMALVLSSVAYSYPMKMEEMTMNMSTTQSQISMSPMSDSMPDCHSPKESQSSDLECDMSSMSMNNNDHCSEQGDNCCKTVCAVSVYALPIGLNTQINSLAFSIKYGFYNEQPRSFSSSSLYRPPIA
ncbi:hypothetical protein ERW51_13940 [Aliivibrio finisterrensis]|uniref:hypothetical protein n=1 Tax=Aliivibrio finisterrensis TaxID=511998 RepID=UPI0010209F4A|nr:hypothetical protein [Aliivibrio finisterrensis]RYU66175.1 hypothetical protein ERW54_14650 [Aliivibrio finisterrensis]RYU69646.1 hypothetical protein ERW51_13940 [Aliivibrio finisterrensis]RYU73102.1 hypothetical protein ERW48_13490 [Aliivibrio finisterrensis]